VLPAVGRHHAHSGRAPRWYYALRQVERAFARLGRRARPLQRLRCEAKFVSIACSGLLRPAFAAET